MAATTTNRVQTLFSRCDVVVVPPSRRSSSTPYRLAAACLIGASVLFHIGYLLWWCPLDLAPDEAHYWLWSRNLDWSYYSKGPLVAWLMRASCEVFGTSAFAVRFPAVVCHAALLAGMFTLAAVTTRCHRTALAVVAAALALPPVTAAAVVMTIDPPFLACWCWALVFMWKAVESTRMRWWVAAGAGCAVGVLAKYTMLLLPAAVGLYLLVNRTRAWRGFGSMLLLALLGCMPIVLWNAAHDWVSFRHVFAQTGGGKGVRWLGPLEFVGGQFAVLAGGWLVAFAVAAWAFRPGASDNGLSFLWWTSVPVWAVFAALSLRSPGQVNWPAPAYAAGLILAVVAVRQYLARPHRRYVVLSLAATVFIGVVASAVGHFPALTRPLYAALAGPPTTDQPAPIRKFDPTCRLRGWRTLAKEVDAIRDRVRGETGTDPALAAMVWTVPGELSFYCRGRPDAYSFGPALADRHSQFDMWRPNPVADAQVFRGRTFVYVGDQIPGAADVFDRVEPPVRVIHAEGGVPVAVWTVWVCHGFRGFPARRPAAY